MHIFGIYCHSFTAFLFLELIFFFKAEAVQETCQNLDWVV